MFVAASTDCFPDLSLDAALSRLVDLEYTRVEIVIREDGNQLKPSEVVSDLDQAIHSCRATYRLTPIAYAVDLPTQYDGEVAKQFAACCKLAKATKVVTLTMSAAEWGTPFNAEVERLQQLVETALVEGVRVAIKTEAGRVTQDPDTAVVLCDTVEGLGLTLDPSHYIHGPHADSRYDHLMKHVFHTQLRDTSKEKLQVRVGQGLVEYGKLVTQLVRVGYDRALCVHVTEMPGVEHAAEMRKIRLLLESLV